MPFFVGGQAGIMMGDMKRAILLSMCMAMILAGGWYGFNVFLFTKQTAFASIQIDDSEETLIRFLKTRGLYDGDGECKGDTAYSHHDGCFGVCIYIVENGRVARKVLD